MTHYEKYVFVLCLIVFVALTALFGTLLTYVIKLWFKLIRCGLEDKAIYAEYIKKRRKSKIVDLIANIFSTIICVGLCAVFAFSMYLSVTKNEFSQSIPTLKVVQSGSMSYRHPANKYLFEKGIDDQIGTFDLIVVHSLPEEEEIKLYDIVVYEKDGNLIVHRIISIDKPDKSHSQTYYMLQGDAVDTPDKYPVLYSQMRGIYKGQHFPFVGSFISFMQSPAGWLCILLIAFSVIATPIVEKKINDEKHKRLVAMGVFNEVQLLPPREEPVALLPPASDKDCSRCPLPKKSIVAIFNIKKGELDVLNCVYAIETIKVNVDKKISPKAPFAPLKYGRSQMAKITFKGKLVNIETGSDSIIDTSPKRINIAFRKGVIPIARLIINTRSLDLYLNMDYVKSFDKDSLIADIRANGQKGAVNILLNMCYPCKKHSVEKMILTIDNNGNLILKEDTTK